MKHLILYTFALLVAVAGLSNKLFAQFYIYTVTIQPQNPTEEDTVRIIVRMIYDKSADNYNSKSIIHNGNQFIVSEYFKCGAGISQLNTYMDTINVGKLLKGLYNIKIGMSCISINNDTTKMDSLVLSFTVQQINDISNIVFQDSSFLVYPNPANHELNVVVEGDSETQYQVRLTNLLGQEILKKDFVAQTTIEVANIHPKGMYFMEVKNKNGIINKKIRRCSNISMYKIVIFTPKQNDL